MRVLPTGCYTFPVVNCDFTQNGFDIYPLVVSFSVRLSTETSFNADTVIKYDTVTTNIGDAYSTADGKFTAPYNGTYQVSCVRWHY